MTVAEVNEEGKVIGEKKGVVEGVDLTGAQYVYIDGKKYELAQIMSVGKIPEKKDDDTTETPDKEGDSATKVPEGENGQN